MGLEPRGIGGSRENLGGLKLRGNMDTPVKQLQCTGEESIHIHETCFLISSMYLYVVVDL